MGRVDRLHLLSEQFVMMTNRGIRKRYTVNLYKDTITKEEANFPNEFEFVTDETTKIVGLDESKAQKIKAFEAEVESYKAPSKDFADTIFESLFGEKSLNLQMPELLEPETDKPRKVKSLDEEEEIQYTMSEDEVLPDDDDSLDNHSYDMEVRSNVGQSDRNPRDDRGGNNQNRQHSHQGRDSNNNRPNNNNNGPRSSQNRGPNPNQGRNDGNRSQGNRNTGGRPQGQNQNRGPRSEGQGHNPNPNQNLNPNNPNRGNRQGR
jgi:hypothetical protein